MCLPEPPTRREASAGVLFALRPPLSLSLLKYNPSKVAVAAAAEYIVIVAFWGRGCLTVKTQEWSQRGPGGVQRAES